MYAVGAATAIGLAALFVRVPYVVSRARFVAEEGTYFFADAYNDGWRSIAYTTADYFHVFPRFVANLSLTLGFPIVAIPTVFVVTTIAVYVLIWTMIVTRLELPLPARVALCSVTMLVPIGIEIFGNLLNVQWFLALLPIVIYAGRQPTRTAARIADLVMVAVCFLTGPYGLFLFPLFAVHAGLTGQLARRRAFLWASGIPTALCAVSLLVLGSVDRVEGMRNVTAYGFAQLTTRTFYYPFFTLLVDLLPGVAVVALAIVTPVLLGLLARAVLRSRSTFAQLSLGASVCAFASTVISYGGNPSIPSPYFSSARTFYLPMVFLVWSIIAIVRWDRRTIRVAFAAIVWCFVQLPLLDGIPFGPVVVYDLAWSDYAAEIERGVAVRVPISPEGWFIELDAKPAPSVGDP